MNTIKKANRLTETEVHEVIANMIDAGEKPSALNLLKTLGRGSLTTISKYIASFNSANDDGQKEVNLPALVDVPRELGLSGELLIKKIWTDAKALANQEIESQRTALMQAEADAAAKIAEAMEFSEIQAKRIEELESLIDELNQAITDKDSTIKKLSNDVDNARHNLRNETKNKEIFLNKCEVLEKCLIDANKLNDELRRKIEDNSKKYEEKINRKEDLIKEFEKNIKSLDLQVGKNQIVFDEQANKLESIKNELKECKQECKEAVKLAAKLTGKLEVYEKKTV